MTGCRNNTTNGCAKCPARQPCELPFEDSDSNSDGQRGTWRTYWPALSGITPAGLIETIAALVSVAALIAGIAAFFN